MIRQTCCFTCLIAGSLAFLGGASSRPEIDGGFRGLGHRLYSPIHSNCESFACVPGILKLSPLGLTYIRSEWSHTNGM